MSKSIFKRIQLSDIIGAGCGIFLLAGGTWQDIPTIAGVGTIITAFFMGPLIEFFNVKVARPFLAGKK